MKRPGLIDIATHRSKGLVDRKWLRGLRVGLLGLGLWVNLGEVSGVEVQLCQLNQEPVNAWPEKAVYRYTEAAFLFDRLPQAYTNKGIRSEWPNPLLVRATARLSLPEGPIKLLLRSRRAARLWVNGALVVSNPFPPLIRDGQDPVERPSLDLGTSARFVGIGDQEALVDYDSDGSEILVRLEFFVGGFAKKRLMRPETGETLVAFAQGDSQEFFVLGSREPFPLTDEVWAQRWEVRHRSWDKRDDILRRHQAGKWDPYWSRRHEYARSVLGERRFAGTSETIDRFIDAQIAEANQAFEAGHADPLFHSTVLPLLKDRCFSCHGKKAKGGLRLDSLEGALRGGESGRPAVVPGRPEESVLIDRVSHEIEEERMPPSGSALSSEEIQKLREWIRTGARWSDMAIDQVMVPTPKTEDWEFLRRVSLDVIGVPPSAEMVREFLASNDGDKRRAIIDRLLDDPRWADHWVGYWQDVLAENPTIVNPTLNNTGPFRWWIYESFLDNKPMDRFVTELIMMEGSLYGGGPAGFEMASQNDVPMAAKANVLTTAFLGRQMQCSRCHDAPYHDHKQEDLFALAAMLAREPVTVPKTSSVPVDDAHDDGRARLIEVTLKPGTAVEGRWPFESTVNPEEMNEWVDSPNDSRQRLAYLVTHPKNDRFARVVANRVWHRYFGRGMVSSLNDWENEPLSHSRLLDFLGDELVRSDYDLKHLARLILNSEAYQRKSVVHPTLNRFFAAPVARQLSAEQIVDSLFSSVGKTLRTEPLTIDVAGGRPWNNAIHLGQPRRAWMFGGMANNRDRPSLILPRAQAVVDLLTAFGWRPARQEPKGERTVPLTPLQPAMMSNGVVTSWLTRLSDDHEVTNLAWEASDVDSLVTALFLRILSRYPSPEEHRNASQLLRPGFSERRTDVVSAPPVPRPKSPPEYVTWANHLMPKATTIQLEEARKAKAGDPVTERLVPAWRERLEDLLWSLINLPETIHYP